MVISASEREARRGFLGASDMSALFGYNIFASPYDVYMSKCGPIEEDRSGTAAWIGNHLEPAIVDMVEDKLDNIVYTNKPTQHHANGILAANLDGWCGSYTWRKKKVDEDAVVEIKTEGFTGEPPGRNEANDWGRGGSDHVPPKIMIQVQSQMACSGANTAFVGLLDGYRGKGFRMYKVKRNDSLINSIVRTSEVFWKKYVLTETPPDKEMTHVTIK